MKNKDNSLNKNRKSAIMIVLAVLVVGLAMGNVWTVFYYAPRRVETAGEKINEKYNLLNPVRKFFKQEDLIINFQPLRDYFNDKYEADPNISVYFEYLPTGANIAISKDAEFYPASLLKVPVAMAAAKKIERGEWKWTNELVLMTADKDSRFGTLYKEPLNSTHTIEDLVRRSLSESDNTAHFILTRNLEISEIDDVYSHIGLQEFMETDGSLSAKRYSVIFRTLYSSSFLTEQNSQKLLSYLSQSTFDDYVQTGLPQDVIFAHKIGTDTERKVFLDSGIIYLGGRPYILTVMTKNETEEEAKDIMKDVSWKIFDYVKNYKE